MNPPVLGARIEEWAERLIDYLKRTKDLLSYKRSDASASQDGILLWDTTGYPVISKNGEYRQIILADGYAVFSDTTDQTAAATNTGYPITFNSTAYESGITLGVDNYTLTFDEAGIYQLAFSVQMTSSSSSTKNLWFWPKINGSDVAGSTIKASLHANGETLVMSRSVMFQMSAGDTLAAYWATDSTAASLDASAATAFAPSAPSVILSVTRLRQ
jgi:hypothetical protein